jgi:formylglycine-generating enzyme required for sulfatase activity
MISNRMRAFSMASLPVLFLFVGHSVIACDGSSGGEPGPPEAPALPIDDRAQPLAPSRENVEGTVEPVDNIQDPCSDKALTVGFPDAGIPPLNMPRSCCLSQKVLGGRAGADNTCGPNGDEDCCKADQIPGGTFNRMNDPAFPAFVPNFNLGRYLVTTARFKIFMEQGFALQKKHPPTSPAPFSGSHPSLGAITGWQEAWNEGCGGDGCLPQNEDELDFRVYKDAASQGWGCTLDHYPQHPRYPMGCVDLYLANAFCAWDGGYLITEAQWEYAVRGGGEQRTYAWGSAAPNLDNSVHCAQGGGTWGVDLWCTQPANPLPFDVGHHVAGQGKWGTYDLQGNMMNYTTDDASIDANGNLDPSKLPVPCTDDCVNRAPINRSVARGISFQYPNNLEPQSVYGELVSKRPITVRKDFNGTNFGFRCAYPDGWGQGAKK